jgi:plasmid stabilization system protein ParE
MTYKSVILPTVKEDLREAVKWYNHAHSGLGKKLVARFRERLAELRGNPLTCQIRYSEVHTALVEQFPYMVHYFVDQQNKTIVVISILHTSRDPKIWEERANP